MSGWIPCLVFYGLLLVAFFTADRLGRLLSRYFP